MREFEGSALIILDEIIGDRYILTVTSGSHTIEAVFENGAITVNGSRAAAVTVK